MRYANHITELIGNTPLIKLNKVTEGIKATVLVKAEYFNPGASVKDRIAMRIIDEAEQRGDLVPGGTIVEPTSGNTGVGLALVAQARGYKCVFVCPDKVSTDKRDVLTAYGAEVVVVPSAVPPESPQSYYSVSDRLARELDKAYKPDQFENPAGPDSHYATTGPEIWRDTEGQVTHFVAGAGTGGTVSGTGRYLKEVSADREGGAVQIVVADPDGSIYSGGQGRPWLVEGVGEDMIPGAYDASIPDRFEKVGDAEALAMTRRLAREEGLLVGGSCGMAVAAGLRVARELGPDDVMVILLPDSGRGYLSKVFNDAWMTSHGFDLAGDGAASASASPSIGDVVETLGLHPDRLPNVSADATVADAIKALAEKEIGALPVATATAPLKAGEIIGAVRETELVAALASGKTTASTPVREAMGAKLTMIGCHEGALDASTRLGGCGVAVAMRDGLPQALVCVRDILRVVAR